MGIMEIDYVGLDYGSGVGNMVPDQLKAGIEVLTGSIIAGEVATMPAAE
jgi:hypothetical protein